MIFSFQTIMDIFFFANFFPDLIEYRGGGTGEKKKKRNNSETKTVSAHTSFVAGRTMSTPRGAMNRAALKNRTADFF